MGWRRLSILGLLVAPSALASAPDTASTSTSTPAPASASASEPEPPRRYFYRGYDYGSQSLYNPLTVILNRGYDTLQIHPSRNIFHEDYSTNLGNVFRSVANPFQTISRTEGWGRFLREEIFPLSWTPTSARWIPNYTLHLIGGGLTYRELREWYEDNGVVTPVATTLSILTLYTAAFLNEGIENYGVVGPNTDCLADLYVFDSLGIVLFSFDAVARFFSEDIITSDWSLQPAFALPSGDVHNQGNYFAAKLPLPFHKPLRLFGYVGYSSIGGVSYKFDDGYSVSWGVGGRVDSFVNVGVGSLFTQVAFKPSTALFLDRNESLLASVQVSDTNVYMVSANVYPNAFVHTVPGIGLWYAANRDGSMVFGFSVTRALGLGLGAGPF